VNSVDDSWSLLKSEAKVMTSHEEQTDRINQRGRHLLTLIRASGSKGISRKEMNDAIRSQLSKEDDDQLELLQAAGSITIEQVDLVDHPDVEYLYWAVESHPKQ
jgi:hypothetical protein